MTARHSRDAGRPSDERAGRGEATSAGREAGGEGFAVFGNDEEYRAVVTEGENDAPFEGSGGAPEPPADGRCDVCQARDKLTYRRAADPPSGASVAVMAHWSLCSTCTHLTVSGDTSGLARRFAYGTAFDDEDIAVIVAALTTPTR